jgi:hypothetical protein
LNLYHFSLSAVLDLKLKKVTYYGTNHGEVKPITVNPITVLLKLQLTVSEIGGMRLYETEKSIKEPQYNRNIPK